MYQQNVDSGGGNLSAMAAVAFPSRNPSPIPPASAARGRTFSTSVQSSASASASSVDYYQQFQQYHLNVPSSSGTTLIPHQYSASYYSIYNSPRTDGSQNYAGYQSYGNSSTNCAYPQPAYYHQQAQTYQHQLKCQQLYGVYPTFTSVHQSSGRNITTSAAPDSAAAISSTALLSQHQQQQHHRVASSQTTASQPLYPCSRSPYPATIAPSTSKMPMLSVTSSAATCAAARPPSVNRIPSPFLPSTPTGDWRLKTSTTLTNNSSTNNVVTTSSTVMPPYDRRHPYYYYYSAGYPYPPISTAVSFLSQQYPQQAMGLEFSKIVKKFAVCVYEIACSDIFHIIAFSQHSYTYNKLILVFNKI